MSEFKYGCPYCGQHIRCDSSQSGSVMECPTCLQKIVAPQAPADPDQKFILSGKKLEDRPKAPLPSGAQPQYAPPRRSFPVAGIALFLLLAASGAAAYFYRDELFHPGHPFSTAPMKSSAANPTPTAAPRVAPPVIAPPANDTNWLLNLTGVDFPDTPAAGRIHGQDFLSQRAFLQNGTLAFREGTRGPVEFGMFINFNGAQADALAGKTIDITTNTPVAARVSLRSKEEGQVSKNNFTNGYALHLEFGALAGNHLPGKIYFCAPDDAKSYLAGTFTADVRKPKVPKP